MSTDASHEAAPRWSLFTFAGGAWAPIAVVVVHLIACSSTFPIYRKWEDFDVVMHSCGGIAIAFFLRRALVEATRVRWLVLGARELALTVFGLVCAAAVFWEFLEYGIDRAFLLRTQLSLEDTLSDMAFGIAGCLVFLGAVALRRHSRAS